MPFLQFKGKTAIETYHHTVPHHALEFDEKLSVLGKGEKPSLDGNLIIEGDNLLALKALLPTHGGRIKCIYMDPPYNTGEEKWVFNDNLKQPQFKEWIGQVVGKEEEDACRHDKWCCLMYPRLMLAKDLLSQDGCLFISVDENEVHTMTMLGNEVFRVEKPTATFVWKRRSPSGMVGQPVSTDHETVLMYAQNKDKLLLNGLIPAKSRYKYFDEKRQEYYASTDLTIGMTAEERAHQFYDLVNPRTKVIYPGNPDRVWRFEPDTMKEVIAQDLIIWPDEYPDRKMKRPRFKTFYDPDKPNLDPVSTWIETGSGLSVAGDDEDEEADITAVLRTNLNVEGGRILKEIFGKRVFNYPKPLSLMRSLIELATGSTDTILDCTAGSGTTGHAVLELNAAKKTERKFILVQQQYDTIEQMKKGFNMCKELTAERIRRVIAGYKSKGTKTEVLMEAKVGLRVLQKPDKILAQTEKAKTEAEAEGLFDEVKTECKDGVVRVLGVKQVKGKTEGIDGSFSYARLSEKPILGEYRDITKNPPSYADIAKYVFYTETSAAWREDECDEKTRRIGEYGDTSFYLLYAPHKKKALALDLEFLRKVAAKDKSSNLVIYCEMIWVHRSELVQWEETHSKRVRTMIVPFNLK